MLRLDSAGQGWLGSKVTAWLRAGLREACLRFGQGESLCQGYDVPCFRPLLGPITSESEAAGVDSAPPLARRIWTLGGALSPLCGLSSQCPVPWENPQVPVAPPPPPPTDAVTSDLLGRGRPAGSPQDHLSPLSRPPSLFPGHSEASVSSGPYLMPVLTASQVLQQPCLLSRVQNASRHPLWLQDSESSKCPIVDLWAMTRLSPPPPSLCLQCHPNRSPADRKSTRLNSSH